jgi:hypothetical protein
MICLFESSTCFEQLCAHHLEGNCINTTCGVFSLKTTEWYKITKITRIHCNLFVHKTLTVNVKILVNYLNVVKFNLIFRVVLNILRHLEVRIARNI